MIKEKDCTMADALGVLDDAESSSEFSNVGDAFKKIVRKQKFPSILAPSKTVRASSLYGLCLREECICYQNGISREDVIGFDTQAAFSYGSWYHELMQSMLKQYLYGWWVCPNRCVGQYKLPVNFYQKLKNAEEFGDEIIVKAQDFEIFPHSNCPKCKAEMDYKEVNIYSPKYLLTGHMDGFFHKSFARKFAPEVVSEYVIFELKTAGWGFKAIANHGKPLPQSIWQLNVYFVLTGIPEALLVYASKGKRPEDIDYAVFHVKEDKIITDKIKEDLKGLRLAYKRDAYPRGVCATPNVKRAIGCPVVDKCKKIGGQFK